MKHGIQPFFTERSQCRRRVSLLSVAVGAVLLVPLSAMQITSVREAVQRAVPILRFGVQGPERVVELIRIEATVGSEHRLREVGRVVPRSSAGGRGGGTPQVGRKPRAPERSGPRLPGVGEGAHDLVARALASQGGVPIFQSDELVIERLVRPEYPEDARERGVEGKVSVLALVDTMGQVVDAEVMTASGEVLLDHAAELAVRQCRFRPYRQDGASREVYAVFRFAFRIY